MRARSIVFVGLAILLGGHAAAAEMNGACPLRIPGDVVKADKPVEGWTTTVSEQLHLTASGMMAGSPETGTYLVPQKQSKTAQTYSFERGEGQRWLWCSYGGAGGVQLAKRLDDKATTCTVTTKTKKPESSLSASVACR